MTATAGVLGLAVLGAVVVGSGALAGVRTPTTAAGPPTFVEETASSGLAHRYAGTDPFAEGGGVAVFDCSGDGRPDLYVAGGNGSAALFRNDSATGGPLSFTRVADPVTDLDAATGAYPLDVDADGNPDLVVLRVGQPRLLRGLGGCRFEPAEDRWGLTPPRGWGAAFSATWEGSNARPTLAFGYYLDPTVPISQGYRCGDNQLFRPGASGETYAPAFPLVPGYCALSMLFSDWDGSGRRDLRVSNDRQYYDDSAGQEQLWRVEPGGAPRLYTTADGWVALQLWGMGIASRDLTGDGHPEVYLASQGPNALQTLLAGPERPMFRDIALKRGVEATRPVAGGDPLPSTAWHPEFADANDDGFSDLFVSKGNVGAQPDFAARDPNNLFLGGPDERFREASEAAGVVQFDRARGAAVADLNLDGLPDLVVVNLDAPTRVWRNVGAGTAAAPASMGHWLGVGLRQPGGNRDAIGAWLEIRTGDLVQRQEVTTGGGHIGGELGWLHVGLGPADAADVRVRWPDGTQGDWQRVRADRFVVLDRATAAPVPWAPTGG